jgi:hypothetical protein
MIPRWSPPSVHGDGGPGGFNTQPVLFDRDSPPFVFILLPLLRTQRFNRTEPRGAIGGITAEEQTDARREDNRQQN